MGGRHTVFLSFFLCLLFLSFVVIVIVVLVDKILICRSASGPSAASRVGKELGSELTGVELVR